METNKNLTKQSNLRHVDNNKNSVITTAPVIMRQGIEHIRLG
jgi:hypothetical protein